ncbi:tetratricopeptide repeat protein [Promicromonospora sp. MEB111]|uniref:tetratricopeptide repeat protein n=1 Tax=Promicromonospora sp. MEB111 TaxID=3040301 RepID=UPI00255001D3|nr:tetratricopeptide repeat protein [Promicromonospora sp. MEB111]
MLDDEVVFRVANATDPALEVLVALWSGAPDRAASLLKPLFDGDPTSLRLQTLAADVIRDRGDTSTAIKILEKLVDTHEYKPGEEVAVWHLGEALFVAGDYPHAAARFRRALDLRLATGADASSVNDSRMALNRALDLIPWPLTHTRTWGWGVAFLNEPVDGEIPEVDDESPVITSPLGLCIRVRNASDVNWQADGHGADEQGPALVTIYVDHPSRFARPQRAVVIDTMLETPSKSLRLDDAEGEILLPAPGVRTRVVVSHHDDEWNQPDEVWIDLYSAS